MRASTIYTVWRRGAGKAGPLVERALKQRDLRKFSSSPPPSSSSEFDNIAQESLKGSEGSSHRETEREWKREAKEYEDRGLPFTFEEEEEEEGHALTTSFPRLDPKQLLREGGGMAADTEKSSAPASEPPIYYIAQERRQKGEQDANYEREGRSLPGPKEDETDLIERQIRLEKATSKETLINNLAMVEQMFSSGTGANLKHVVRVMRTWMQPITRAIKREQEKIRRGEPTIDYFEEDNQDLRPYLTNPWARAEEIAYLTVMTVTSTALRDRGGATLAHMSTSIARKLAQNVYNTRKRDLQKRRAKERQQMKKRRGGGGSSSSSSSSSSSGSSSSSHAGGSVGLLDEMREGKSSAEKEVYDADPLAKPFWPPDVSVRIGTLLIQLVIQHAYAPEWWLETGARRWVEGSNAAANGSTFGSSSGSSDGRSSSTTTTNESGRGGGKTTTNWASTLPIPKEVKEAVQTYGGGGGEHSGQAAEPAAPAAVSEAASPPLSPHDRGDCDSFPFPMWLPIKPKTTPRVAVFEHTLRRQKNHKKYRVAGWIRVNPLVRTAIEQVHAIGYEPKHLPMLSKPRPWSAPNKGGYLTFDVNLLRGGGVLQDGALRNANLSNLFEGLNAMGETPWCINKPVLNVVKEMWKAGGGKANLPDRKDLRGPSKPDPKMMEEDEEMHKRWEAEKAMVETENANRHSLRCDLELKLGVVERFQDDSFYFPFNIDFRGRTYPIPPHFNHLGADVNRGLLLFHEAKPLGDKGMDWLKIHLANLCGNDKVSFNDRVEWVDERLEKVLKVADDPLEHTDLWFEADDPFQALATCFEIATATRSGSDVSSFKTKLPTHQDGSCNGLQHYAALGRDEFGGAAVNLTPHDRPQDVYSAVGVSFYSVCASCCSRCVSIENFVWFIGVCVCVCVSALCADDKVLKLVLEKLAKAEEEGNELALILKGVVNRKVVKQTVMTSVYGVTFIGARDQIRNRLRERKGQMNFTETYDVKGVEEKVTECSKYLALLTLHSITDLFNCAKDIMNWLGESASLITSLNLPVSWVTPMGLPVVQPYRRPTSYRVNTALQQVTLLDLGDQLPVHNTRHRSAFPPNFVHSLDSTHMLLTAIQCKKEGITYASVHDSYWTHPGTMDKMNKILRDEFIGLYERPILEELAHSFERRFPEIEFPPVPARGNLDLQLVRESKYFFA